MDGKSDDVIGELQAQLRDSQAQIARERLANKELALRLQAQKEDAANAKALLEALRHGAGDASSPSAALSSSLARSGVEVPMRPVQAPAPSDLSSYQRVIAAVARGKELSAAVRFEASFCHLGQGVAAFLTSLGLAGALLPFPEPPLEPAPLVDSFYIAGPSLGELARALRACRRAAAGTSSPQALTPSVLLCLTSAGAAGGVVPPLPPDAAAQYCFPEGCTLSALPSAAQSVGGGFSGAADRFVGAGAAVSSRRGPRSHVFVVNGGASERGADADAASEAAARAGRPVNGRTRYGVCLQLPVPLTLPPHPSASSSAGSGGASDGPPLSARTASAYAAPPDDTVVVVPLSFCVVSRYPFFPLLFDAALACQTAWWAALVPGLLAALPGPGGGLPPRGSGAASGSDEAHSDEVRVAAPTAPRRNSDSASQAHSHPLSLAEGISVTAPAPAWKALLQRGLTTVRLLVPPTHAPTLGSGAAGRSDPESSSSKGTPRRQSSEPPPATASPGDTLSGAASLLKGFWRGEGVPGGSAGSPAGAEGEPLEADPGADAAVSAIRGALAFPALRELALSVMNAVVPAPGATLRLHLPRAARSARGVARPATDGSGALRYERPLPFPLDSFRGGPEVGGGRTALQMAGVALRALSGGGGTLAALHAASSVADLEHLSWPSDPPESSALPPAGVAAPPSPPRWLLGRDFSHAETWAAAVDWAAPVLFSVLPVDSVLLLVGAALTEHSIVLVGGELSHEALSCCVLALACLLQPLSWVGAFQPVLPSEMGHLLDAPTPLLVGVAHLPSDWVQDDRTVVALLDRETVRVRHAPAEVASGRASDSGGGALESHADVLKLQLPGNSALYSQLEPVAAVLRTGSGSGSGSTIARDLTARPCYHPTPSQRHAAALLSSAVCCYVRGLLQTVVAAARIAGDEPSGLLYPPLPLCRAAVLAACSESEAPFWTALLDTQMLAFFFECQNDLAQASSWAAGSAPRS